MNNDVLLVVAYLRDMKENYEIGADIYYYAIPLADMVDVSAPTITDALRTLRLHVRSVGNEMAYNRVNVYGEVGYDDAKWLANSILEKAQSYANNLRKTYQIYYLLYLDPSIKMESKGKNIFNTRVPRKL